MSANRPRELLGRARRRLDEWTYEARERAYEELFEGEDPLLTEADLARLDRIDSELTRRDGQGLWGADEYGIVATGVLDEDSSPQVVCTYHPEVPEYAYQGAESLEEEVRREYDEALWTYCERVVENLQERLDSFVREEGSEAESP